jgi:hypothetical protein
MGICLAFHASWLENLNAESGKHPLSLWRNPLLCEYAVKVTSQPDHPTYGAVFCPTLHNRFELNPVGVCFHQLLQQLNIRLPRIMLYRLSQIQAMEIIHPTFKLQLVTHPRGATSSLTYCLCFTEELSSYLDHMALYTDGSFLDESTGSAFIYDVRVFS